MTSLIPDLIGYASSVDCPCQGHSFNGKDLKTRGTEAPLPLRVLRDIPDETVKALVDCLVIITLLATATMAVIGVAYESAGPRVTLALTVKRASSAPVDPCPTVFSVTPFV